MKKVFAFFVLLAVLMTGAIAGAIQVSAAYDYLFPVNNGGVVGYAYGYSASYGSFHVGIDLHDRLGDDTVYAAYSGYVGATANSCPHISIYPTKCEHYSTFGNFIRIDQDDGTYAYYGHLKLNSLLVKTGDYVVKGQPIATIGSSGYSTGPHLHFEVRKVRSNTDYNVNVNPVSSGGEVNYSYTGYGATTQYQYTDINAGVYYFKNALGKYMSVEGAAESDGQNIIASDFSNGSAFQFEVSKGTSGYQLRPLCAENSVVNNYGYSVANGNNITLWEITDHASQQWKFEQVEGGYIIRSAMNPNCCIAVNSENNVYVSTYSEGDKSQIWNIEFGMTFDLNGGSAEFENIFKSYGEKIALPDEIPVRDGCIFLGWSTEKDSEFVNYAKGKQFEVSDNIDLYAVWYESENGLGDNLAYQKDYKISGSGVGFGDYTANLTDGNSFGEVAYDNNWFAFYYSEAAESDKVNAPNGVGEVVIDLEKVYSINAININLINSKSASVIKPLSVKVYLSEDGENFVSAGTMPLADIESKGYWSFAGLEGNARYVKIEFALADFFAFVNEIEIYGSEYSEGSGDVLLGDINSDGAIDQYDYILAKRHHFETIVLVGDDFVRADVNKDSVVDQYDYILLKRHHFGNFVIGQ